MAKKPRTLPRKAPSQARARATRDAILEATARVLVKDGFDHASTNRIADVAGVSIGSLYQYFPSKEALVAALAERHMEEMTQELAAAMERVARLDLRDAVSEMVELSLRAHAIDPALHKVLIEQVPRVGRLERVHEVERQMQKLARGWLELHRGEIADKDLDLAAFVAVTVVEALTHAVTTTRPEQVKDRAIAHEITDLLVRYLERR